MTLATEALEALTQEIARVLEDMGTPNPTWLQRQKSIAEIVNVLQSIWATGPEARAPGRGPTRRL